MCSRAVTKLKCVVAYTMEITSFGPYTKDLSQHITHMFERSRGNVHIRSNILLTTYLRSMIKHFL